MSKVATWWPVICLSLHSSRGTYTQRYHPYKVNYVLQPFPQPWFFRIIVIFKLQIQIIFARILHASQLPQLPVHAASIALLLYGRAGSVDGELWELASMEYP